MSHLLALAQAVVATPVPTPSPAVVKEVVTNNVTAVPSNVLNLFNLLALAAAGAVTSVVHLAVERGKLSSNTNRLLFTLYSAIAGVAVVVLGGQWHWDTAAVVSGLTAFLAFLGSTQGQKMLLDFASKLINSTTTNPATGEAVPLTTDEDPAQAPA